MLLSSLFRSNHFKLIIVIILIVVFSIMMYAFIALTRQTFYDGITFEGIELSGLERPYAGKVIDELFRENYANKLITLRYNDKSWSVVPNDINLRFSTDIVLDKAYSVGHTGNIFKRLYEIEKLKYSKKNIAPEFQFDEKLLVRILTEIKSQIDEKGSNAAAKYENDKIIFINDKPGKVVDINKNLLLLSEKFSSGDFYDISLIVDESEAEITVDDIKDINHVLSTFTTSFNPNDINRTYNINLSCEKINGVILMPGDIFSMNKTLGPRNAENGYKEARIVYKNEYIDGIGGGVCQTTTTLYNSVLKSRLKVIERSHHSLPSLYVGLGQDATIAEDYIDFKFKNNKGYPISISTEVVQNKMNIRILGRKEDPDFTVKLVSKVVEQYVPDEEEIEIDNSLMDGVKIVERQPKSGFRVILYRETYDAEGKLKSREKISEDVYKPVKALVKVNESYYNNLYDIGGDQH